MLDCSMEEDDFGPIVSPSCLHGFDFTLLFEEGILTLGPIGVVCLAASIRIWKLSGVPEKVNRSWLYTTKEVLGPPSSKHLCFPIFLALTIIA